MHGGIVAGVDEAGRGPLAGPVVAAAVVLDWERVPAGINDSKKLTAEVRERLHGEIHAVAHVGVGIASVEEIGSLNILHASLLAMIRAVDALALDPGIVLVDGNRAPKWTRQCVTVVKGDALSLSIAAASIVAKVTRDRLMLEADLLHPGYGWARNKGYPTPDHHAALREKGPSPLHRRGFAAVDLHFTAN